MMNRDERPMSFYPNVDAIHVQRQFNWIKKDLFNSIFFRLFASLFLIQFSTSIDIVWQWDNIEEKSQKKITKTSNLLTNETEYSSPMSNVQIYRKCFVVNVRFRSMLNCVIQLKINEFVRFQPMITIRIFRSKTKEKENDSFEDKTRENLTWKFHLMWFDEVVDGLVETVELDLFEGNFTKERRFWNVDRTVSSFDEFFNEIFPFFWRRFFRINVRVDVSGRE